MSPIQRTPHIIRTKTLHFGQVFLERSKVSSIDLQVKGEEVKGEQHLFTGERWAALICQLGECKHTQCASTGN